MSQDQVQLIALLIGVGPAILAVIVVGAAESRWYAAAGYGVLIFWVAASFFGHLSVRNPFSTLLAIDSRHALVISVAVAAISLLSYGIKRLIVAITKRVDWSKKEDA